MNSAKSFIGSPYIMSEIGKSLDVALDGLTVATTDPKESSGGGGFWGWLSDTWNGFWDSVDFVLGGFFTHAVVILKLMIIALGLVYIALVGVMTVITSKIFLFIALGFGPIFVMFGAFETTRNWFWAWLSSTMGYFLTAVLVFAVWAFMIEIMKNHFFQPHGDEAITWVDCCRAFLSCFFFAKIMSRVGDLASSWFSAGNMTDSTNAMMVASGVAGSRGLTKGGRVVGGVTAQTGRGIGRGARGLRNRTSRTRVSNT